jgi:hypothetical protein
MHTLTDQFRMVAELLKVGDGWKHRVASPPTQNLTCSLQPVDTHKLPYTCITLTCTHRHMHTQTHAHTDTCTHIWKETDPHK